jgi:hypothetical protein
MELFCLAKCSIFKFTSKKKPKYLLQREIAKYDDTNELKDEQRNYKLYLNWNLSYCAYPNYFLDHNRGESELVSGALW